MEEGNKRYTELKTQFETLQEFVAENVGISHGSPTAATPGTTGTSPSPPQVTAFTSLRNGARRITFNRFSILRDQVDVHEETRLIGNSIVRGQLEEFCRCVPSSGRRYCFHGASLKDITALIDNKGRLY